MKSTTMPKKNQPDQSAAEGVLDLVFSPPSDKALATPSPPKPPPETALGIKPSRFVFVNRRNQQRIAAYTGVIQAATGLVNAQTDLERAKSALFNLPEELEREQQRGQLEGITLQNQIEEQRRKQRLSGVEEERQRAELEAHIRQSRGAEEAAVQGKVSPEEARKKVFAAVQELEQEMQRVLVGISKGKEYDDLPEEEQERFDRVKNTYADLVDRKYDQLEKTE